MKYCLGLACFLLASLPHRACAQQTPPARQVESLLAADAVAYFRYDGYQQDSMPFAAPGD